MLQLDLRLAERLVKTLAAGQLSVAVEESQAEHRSKRFQPISYGLASKALESSSFQQEKSII